MGKKYSITTLTSNGSPLPLTNTLSLVKKKENKQAQADLITKISCCQVAL